MYEDNNNVDVPLTTVFVNVNVPDCYFRFIFNKMNKVLLNSQLKTCEDSEFFDILENCVGFRIPKQLRKILSLNLLNNAVSLSRDIHRSTEEIEHFMRIDFNKNMIKSDESVAEYLGIWKTNQKAFRLMSGQKRMLRAISEYCQQLYPVDNFKRQ